MSDFGHNPAEILQQLPSGLSSLNSSYTPGSQSQGHFRKDADAWVPPWINYIEISGGNFFLHLQVIPEWYQNWEPLF